MSLKSPFALVLIAGTCLSLAACDKEDSTRTAIRTASTKLEAVSGGAASPATNSVQQKLYEEANKAAQGAGGTGASAAAANILSATATQGKASVPGATSSNIAGGAEMAENAGKWEVTEIGIYNRINSLRARLSEYSDHKHTASAAALFNPSAQIANLDKLNGDLDKMLSDRSASKAQLEGQIAKRQADAKVKSDEAAKLDARSGEVRKGIAAVSATQAATIVEQASKLKRDADKLRLEAQIIEGDISELKSRLPELQLGVTQLESQKAGIARTKADLAAKIAFNQQQATKSNEDAAKVAAAIEAEITDLKKTRDGSWTRANDDRLSMLRTALGTAQKANADAPLQAKLATGSIQQMIGDVQLSRAVEARSYGLLMTLLGNSQPALPKAEEYKADATAADKVREDAATAAKDAYAAAKAAYSSAPVKGSKESAEIKARLDKVGVSLEAVSQALSSGSNASLKDFGFTDAPTPPPAAAPEAAPAAEKPAAAAPAANDAPAELIAAADAFLEAGKSGDSAKMLAACKATTPMAQQLVGVATSMSKLDAACKAKFGKSFSEQMKATGMNIGTDFSKLDGVKGKDLKFNVTGDKATTDLAGAPLAFAKDGATWKFDMDSLGAQMGANPAIGAMLGKMGPGLDAIAADVTSGKIPNMQAVQMRFMGLMAGGAGGLPGGGPDK